MRHRKQSKRGRRSPDAFIRRLPAREKLAALFPALRAEKSVARDIVDWGNWIGKNQKRMSKSTAFSYAEGENIHDAVPVSEAEEYWQCHDEGLERMKDVLANALFAGDSTLFREIADEMDRQENESPVPHNPRAMRIALLTAALDGAVNLSDLTRKWCKDHSLKSKDEDNVRRQFRRLAGSIGVKTLKAGRPRKVK